MPKLQVELLVLCDQAILSREGKLSIIGIFDQIFSEILPGNYPKMSVVGILRGESGSVNKVNLIIENPAGEIPFNNTLEVNLGPNGKANVIAELASFPTPVAGTYKIKILVDKKELGSLEFRVQQVSGLNNGSTNKGPKIIA